MPTSEIVINDYLAEELRKKYPAWQAPGLISCENTGMLMGLPSARPDIIIRDNPASPVSVETEFHPANTVEQDAIARLGKVFAPTGGTIYAAVAVRLPDKYRHLAGAAIAAALSDEAELEYCLLSGDPASPERWPSVGYVRGSVADLAYVVTTARVSQAIVDQGATILEEGARTLAAMLEAAATQQARLETAVGESLKQEASPQTYAMAATIIVNAFVFQETIAGSSQALANVKGIYDVGATPGHPTKSEIIAEWETILSINYWPIFGIAKALLTAVPSAIWGSFSRCSLDVADRLLSLNVGTNPDLIGTIFQRLISDRRFLATFYTAPSSAALVARLMIGSEPPQGGTWSDEDKVKSLKLADFACGTGSLLCSLYAEVRNSVEHAGTDSRTLHQWMIENSLVGCDVIPSATHITATQLSAAFPTIQYTDTKILTMPFGRMPDGTVALGALDLLETQAVMPTIATHAEGVGAHSETELDPWKALGGTFVEDQSFDLIAMNPPFTRLTGGGGKSEDQSRPLFAAFGTTEADQEAMARKASALFRHTAYHGNAGAASAFVEIVHRKIKNGGTIGLILPLAALAGASWEACRTLWRSHYVDIVILTIASDAPGASAFSADTGVAECMIVATRSLSPSPTALSVSLKRRPVSNLEGVEIARAVRKLVASGNVRSVEDAPLGGTILQIGDEKIGEAVTTPLRSGPWLVSRIHDHATAQVGHQLYENGKVWLPGMLQPIGGGAFCHMSDLGVVGPYHLDVGGGGISGGASRGPFEVVPTDSPASATFPILAAHNQARERYVELEPDAEGIARQASTVAGQAVQAQRLQTIWDTRTRLHFATDVRFNANALIACCTTREAVGGRAWPSYLLNDRRYEKAASLWFNSTLGILSFWWLSSKPQDGRGSVTTSRLQDLVSFDFRQWTDADLAEADTMFDTFKANDLMDIHECAIDPNREELDRFIVRHFLKVTAADQASADNGMQLLRAKLSLEPSITGGRH